MHGDELAVESASVNRVEMVLGQGRNAKGVSCVAETGGNPGVQFVLLLLLIEECPHLELGRSSSRTRRLDADAGRCHCSLGAWFYLVVKRDGCQWRR